MRFLLLLCLLLTPVAARAELVREGQGVVQEVTDGDTVILDGGIIVRLAGIQAPKLPLGRRNFPTWPLAHEARAALQALTRNESVELAYGGARTDRHRRVLAQLYRHADGMWIQGEMLRLGMARVYTFSDNRSLASEMLALERAARAAGRGIWAQRFYQVRAPLELNQHLESFQLVEGKILKSAKISDTIFLNFGEDYKVDFTVVIERRDWPRFPPTITADLTGRTVRVRGWLQYWNGPMLRASHPEQIEVLK